ncbi:multiple inositol polyphosphate phosphatase 1-like isoform X2 [Littorina saxatilis]|uniref:Multiple inositol polyphosphate phosphatase 1 n=2 Tax=Littorina saxatilis TaxID=31220 RepID=A0AAN9AUY6_9CAEN
MKQIQDVARIYNRMKKRSFNWDSKSHPQNDNKDLVKSGREELKLLGKRTAIRLSSLFTQTTQLEYWTSKKQRTKDSAQEFNAGFTDVHPQFSKSPVYAESEEQLRFHAYCIKYQQVQKQKATLAEYDHFKSKQNIRQEMDRARQAISTGLDLDDISDDEIVALYYMCGYETAISKSSPWCSFLKEHGVVEVLEYLDDLKVYYQLGPAYPITWKLSCPLVTEIVREMDKAIAAIDKGHSYVRGRFAFGHTETLGPLLSALGIFDDQPPLKAENFKKEKQRKFKSSTFLPFAANVHFVLYKCGSVFRLKLYINEKEFPFLKCKAGGCPFDTVKKMLNDKGLIQCDNGRLCDPSRKQECQRIDDNCS